VSNSIYPNEHGQQMTNHSPEKNQQWLEMEQTLQDNGGSQRVKSILRYVLMNMGYSHGRDSVIYYPIYNKSEVYFNDICIAIIDKRNKVVILPKYEEAHKTKPVKEMVNRILMRFCGVKLFQKNRAWSIVKPYEDNMNLIESISVPFHELDS
jgi:hypothetical protein